MFTGWWGWGEGTGKEVQRAGLCPSVFIDKFRLSTHCSGCAFELILLCVKEQASPNAQSILRVEVVK